MLGKIEVENIRLYAYHGCLDEEGKIGSDYRVDVVVWGDLSAAAKSDALSKTIDYVQINKIATEEMLRRSKLLEHVAQRIIERLFAEIALIEKAEVRVAKLMPPINGDVEAVAVTLFDERKGV